MIGIGVLAFACALPCSAAATPMRLADGRAAGLELKETLPQVPMRGYGTVSGKLWAAQDGGSALDVTCDSEEHARLPLSKYLSDLLERSIARRFGPSPSRL